MLSAGYGFDDLDAVAFIDALFGEPRAPYDAIILGNRDTARRRLQVRKQPRDRQSVRQIVLFAVNRSLHHAIVFAAPSLSS